MICIFATKMSQKATKRIALLLGQDNGYCRGVTSGIIRYVESIRPNWVLRDSPADARVLPDMLDWEPDGIIVHLFDRQLAETLSTLGIPLISTTDTLKGIRVCRVDVDNEAVGTMAAEYFLRMGFRSFGYYGSNVAQFSIARHWGFEKTLTSASYRVSRFDANFLPRLPFGERWDYLDESLKVWLEGLPKPAAILASNDVPARMLCESCRALGIQVPEQVAILGVDNDTSECRMASTSISSVDTPSQAIGYRSAELLSTMLSSGSRVLVREKIAPVGIVERASTQASTGLNDKILKALRFIEENSRSGIAVTDVAVHCGLSRRSLERLFQSELSGTVLREIHRVQLEHAKQLLRETDLRVGEIAERTGVGSSRKLDRLFTKFGEEAPRSYRIRCGIESV